MVSARPNRALWVTCWAAFLAFAALWPIHALTHQEMGWDFTQFYLAARLPASQLYDRRAQLDLAHELFEGTKTKYFPPYVRPAVFALALTPLGWLPYREAFLAWSAIQFACYLAALALLRRLYPYPPEMLLGWALFYPAMHGIWEGQDAPAVLLLVLAAFLQLSSGSERIAGVLFGLCVYKFNLFLLLPPYLIALRRWRALRYGLVVAALVIGVSSLLQSPRRYVEYLRRIPEMSIGFGQAAMPGWRGLAGEWPWLYGLLGAATLLAAVWAMRRTDQAHGLAVATAGSLLISYHVTWYDLTLLAIPIAVSLATAGRLARLASLALLVGVPLWLISPRYLTVVEALLFAGLVAAARRRRGASDRLL